MKSRTLLFALLLALAAAVGPSARAETRDATTVTLGWQTENADAIVLAQVAEPAAAGAAAADPDAHAARDLEARVEQTLKGDVALGAVLRVTSPDHGLGSVARPGVPHLLFLRAVRAADGTVLHYAPLSGAFSVKPIAPDTVEARFPALVTSLRDTLELRSPDALRVLLVHWMDDADPGIAWSAATDFVRHTELHASLAQPESARIVAAYRRQPIGKNTKDALAYAAAATRTPEAVTALVDSLLAPDANRIRSSVAEALRRMETADAERQVVARMAAITQATSATGGASTTAARTAEQRRALLGALAVVGGTTAVPSVTPLLTDTDASVRTDAAAALGGMARNARAKDPDARLGVAATLAAGLTDAAVEQLPENELRATLWALAQLDEPTAFDTLRRIAETTKRPEIQSWAKRLLDRPRQSLLLRE